jgi:hypothetical protein
MPGPFTNYTSPNILNISTPGNATMVRFSVLTNLDYMIAHFCFDVTGVDVAAYSHIRVESMIEGGSGPNGGSPPNASNFTLGVWNKTLNAYDANLATGGPGATQISLAVSAATTPTQARFPLNSGAASCIIVTVISNGVANGSSDYSILGLLHLAVILEP